MVVSGKETSSVRSRDNANGSDVSSAESDLLDSPHDAISISGSSSSGSSASDYDVLDSPIGVTVSLGGERDQVITGRDILERTPHTMLCQENQI